MSSPSESAFRSFRARCGDGMLTLVEALSPTRRHDNPSFALTLPAARELAEQLRRTPVRLPRPVLIINGYRGPDFQSVLLNESLRSMTDPSPGQWLAVSYPHAADLSAMVAIVMRQVQQRWPLESSTEPNSTPADRQTGPLDVVAISMGGLVAEIAALGTSAVGLAGPPLPRLNIVRLFTLATPHQGARLADKIAPDPAARAVRYGSPLLARLSSAWAAHRAAHAIEQVCYTRLGDQWVGATRAAPPGQLPIWVEGCGLASHATVSREPRILADLALRLRGEKSPAQLSQPPHD